MNTGYLFVLLSLRCWLIILTLLATDCVCEKITNKVLSTVNNSLTEMNF